MFLRVTQGCPTWCVAPTAEAHPQHLLENSLLVLTRAAFGLDFPEDLGIIWEKKKKPALAWGWPRSPLVPLSRDGVRWWLCGLVPPQETTGHSRTGSG